MTQFSHLSLLMADLNLLLTSQGEDISQIVSFRRYWKTAMLQSLPKQSLLASLHVIIQAGQSNENDIFIYLPVPVCQVLDFFRCREELMYCSLEDDSNWMYLWKMCFLLLANSSRKNTF